MRTLLALVLFVLDSAVGAQTMPTCSSGMNPYRVELYSGYTGLTPSEACTAAGVGFSAATGTGSSYAAVLSNGKCEVYYAGAGSDYQHAITQVCEPSGTAEPPSDPASSPTSSAQYSGLMTILAAAFAVICFGLGFNSGWQA